MRFYFTKNNPCDNSEPDLGSSQISVRINYAFPSRIARVLSPSIDDSMPFSCMTFPCYKFLLAFSCEYETFSFLIEGQEPKVLRAKWEKILISKRQ